MMPADKTPTHVLHKSLGLRDLVPMQILIVIGTTWPGTAAHQAGTQVSFWLIGAALEWLTTRIFACLPSIPEELRTRDSPSVRDKVGISW